MAQIIEGEYQGNPMLIIRRDASDRFPFQFGIKKAELMLLYMKEIRAFVEKHKGETPS